MTQRTTKGSGRKHLEAAAQVQVQQVWAVVGNAGNAHIREALTPPQVERVQSPAATGPDSSQASPRTFHQP